MLKFGDDLKEISEAKQETHKIIKNKQKEGKSVVSYFLTAGMFLGFMGCTEISDGGSLLLAFLTFLGLSIIGFFLGFWISNLLEESRRKKMESIKEEE